LDTPALNLYEDYTIAHQMVGLRWLRDVCAPACIPRRPHLNRPESPVSFSSFLVLSNAGCAILRAGWRGLLPPKDFPWKCQRTSPPLPGPPSAAPCSARSSDSPGAAGVTGGTARKESAAAVRDAVVVALAPICVDRFSRQPDAATKITELSKASTWDRSNVIAKSGFATMPGAKEADSDVARACAEILANPPTPKT
jgi:hypothetical protein